MGLERFGRTGVPERGEHYQVARARKKAGSSAIVIAARNRDEAMAAPIGAPPGRASASQLEVDRAHLAAAILLEIVLDALILIEGRHAGPLYRGDVNEGVVAAIIGGDEAIALVGVEEFDGASGGHVGSPSFAGRADCRHARAAAAGKEGRGCRKAPKTVDVRL